MQDFKAWLVDLDGTLYRPKPMKLVMGAWLVLAAPQALTIVRAFRQEHERLREHPETITGDPYRQQLENTALRTGLPIGKVREVVERWMIQRPCQVLSSFKRTSLIAEITAFQAAGGKAGLVSDYPARKKLQALGVLELFDTIVANGEAGGPTRLKPDPVGYLLAAERLGVAPAQCLVIGDRTDADGAAAEAASMSFRLIG